MEWHDSGVMSAINECKKSKSLLVVYVKDSSEGSASTDNSWTDQQVQDVLSNNSYVALQLLYESVEYNQLMQFFPVFVVPSILCISPTGQQLAVFSGPADASQVAATLKQGFQQLSPVASNSGTEEGHSIEAIDYQEHPDVSISDNEEEKTEDDDEAKKQEQIQRYREKMAQNKLEKEEEAKKREKTNELRRRREGREMGDWKKEQQDRERQALIKERQKERNEQLRARQEVLAKLEQDKQEKLSRQRSSGSNQGEGAVPAATPTVPSVLSAVGNNSSCRIQVKLPGAQSAVFVFESSDTVSDLRQKVAERVEYSPNKVMLTCVYPRKELGIDLDETTLDQHDLVPNGVVIARLKGSGSGASNKPNGGGVLSLLFSLFQFILQLLVSLKNAITGLFTSNQADTGRETASQQINNRHKSYAGSAKPSQKQTRKDDQGSRFKQVRAEDDDDDPNNTYNGNSTQQL